MKYEKGKTQYTKCRGLDVIILPRIKGSVKTLKCPFCNQQHRHEGDGHRAVHCNSFEFFWSEYSTDPRRLKVKKVIKIDGIELKPENGYYVATIMDNGELNLL